MLLSWSLSSIFMCSTLLSSHVVSSFAAESIVEWTASTLWSGCRKCVEIWFRFLRQLEGSTKRSHQRSRHEVLLDLMRINIKFRWCDRTILWVYLYLVPCSSANYSLSYVVPPTDSRIGCQNPFVIIKCASLVAPCSASPANFQRWYAILPPR